ncbi:CRISPR-associated protein Cas4, partial [Caldivirga sp.]|uniref:CRISPR-associated protein Cas4 n=1 Tax=Caldivirga sp. TaxID=2080243 RepID=UPI003D0BDD33
MDDYIPVTLVKEYVYCPRQAYFKVHLHYEPPTTSMAYAKEYWKNINIEGILKANGIEGNVIIEVPLRSSRLGLVGKADAILVNNGELHIIEAKINVSKRNLFTKQVHILAQSLAYGLMAEETFKRSLSHLIFISGNGSVIKVKVTP